MFDLVADYPRNNSKLPTVHRKCTPAELEGGPMVEDSTEEEAALIMRKLVDAYWNIVRSGSDAGRFDRRRPGA